MARAVTTGFGVGMGATRRWALHKQEYHIGQFKPTTPQQKLFDI